MPWMLEEKTMNPIIFTLILMSIVTVGGILEVRRYEKRLDKYYGIFLVTLRFTVDGYLVAALL